ncbi:MAG TPA: pseudouridine synthase, partial [Nakamurella sp.]
SIGSAVAVAVFGAIANAALGSGGRARGAETETLDPARLMTATSHVFLGVIGLAGLLVVAVACMPGGRGTADPTAMPDSAGVEDGDRVEVDGQPVGAEPAVHLLLNKPRGVITTAADTHGRQTVLDLVDPGVRVFPVGRLDRDTTGALVLTNDGQLANALMHPSGGVPKTYVAEVQGSVREQDIHALEAGVELEDGLTAPAAARAVQPTVVELTIHEGRNRQVRRMLEAVGHPVIALHRSSYAGLGVSDLSPGAWRPLRPEEVAQLRAAGSR